MPSGGLRLFAHYANDQRQSQIQQIIQQIEEQYLPESQGYNIDALEVIGNAALQNGLIVHVQARNGEVDWDISVIGYKVPFSFPIVIR